MSSPYKVTEVVLCGDEDTVVLSESVSDWSLFLVLSGSSADVTDVSSKDDSDVHSKNGFVNYGTSEVMPVIFKGTVDSVVLTSDTYLDDKAADPGRGRGIPPEVVVEKRLDVMSVGADTN